MKKDGKKTENYFWYFIPVTISFLGRWSQVYFLCYILKMKKILIALILTVTFSENLKAELMLSFTGDTVNGIVDKFTDDYGRYNPCVRGLWEGDALRAIGQKNRGNAGGIPRPQIEMLIFVEYEKKNYIWWKRYKGEWPDGSPRINYTCVGDFPDLDIYKPHPGAVDFIYKTDEWIIDLEKTFKEENYK